MRSGDVDFEYVAVESDEAYNVLEHRDAKKKWFDDEDPRWDDICEGQGRREGETGV